MTFIFENDTVSRVLGKAKIHYVVSKNAEEIKGTNSEKIERNIVDKNMDSEQIGKFVCPRSKMFVLFLFVCIFFYSSVMPLQTNDL